MPDSCTKIIRHGHYDFQKKTFYGNFTDVNKDDSTQLVLKGNYINGEKNGLFVFYYLNGKLRAKGYFNDNKYTGDWVFYYPNGMLTAKGAFQIITLLVNGKPTMIMDSHV